MYRIGSFVSGHHYNAVVGVIGIHNPTHPSIASTDHRDFFFGAKSGIGSTALTFESVAKIMYSTVFHKINHNSMM